MIWGDTSMKGHTDPDLLPTGTLTGWYWVVPQAVELFSDLMWGSWLWIPFDRGQCLVICDQLGGQFRDINWVLISLDLKLKESGMLHITYPMLPIHTLFRRSLITSIWIWEEISCDIVCYLIRRIPRPCLMLTAVTNSGKKQSIKFTGLYETKTCSASEMPLLEL